MSKESIHSLRIPESSCTRMEIIEIEIPVTSKNGDRKIIGSIRMTVDLPREQGSGTTWASSDEHLP